MNLATALVLLLLLALAVLAVRRIRRKRLLFSCGGDCSACAGGCRCRRSQNLSAHGRGQDNRTEDRQKDEP